MKEKEKGDIISKIIEALRAQATLYNKQFDANDLFLQLAFTTDEGLEKIAKLCGCQGGLRCKR